MRFLIETCLQALRFPGKHVLWNIFGDGSHRGTEATALTHERAEKVFPAYFQSRHVQLPPEAALQVIEVYRACRTGKVERESFLNTYEENGFQVPAGLSPDDPQVYSLSTFTRPNYLQRIVTVHSDDVPPWVLAKGSTTVEDGPSCETRIWKRKRKSRHVDWWLYEGAEPWRAFAVEEGVKDDGNQSGDLPAG